MKGLNPTEKSFLWKMINNLLPSQSRLFRLKINNTHSPLCSKCDRGESDDLTHALITCSLNIEISTWLMTILQTNINALQPKQVVLLDLGPLDEACAYLWYGSSVPPSLLFGKPEEKINDLLYTKSDQALKPKSTF